MIWTCGSGRIDLHLTLAEARGASHQGQCAADVLALSRVPRVAKQLAKLDPAIVRAELAEYGAWDEAELADHDQNLQRLLWIAASDIREEHYAIENR